MTFPSLILTVLIGITSSVSTTPEPPKKAERIGAPYLLDVCAVSGKKLPADGGVVMIMEGKTDALQTGREVRFCCKGCQGAFSKDPAKFIPKIDELIIADQMPRYPKSVPCIVMTDELLPDPTGKDARDCKMIVTRNRLVRLCCGKCVRMFKRDPAKYIEVLDTAVITEAKAAGKIKTCATNGRPLGDRANWFVLGDRALATCCKGCQPKAIANPRATFARVDAAQKSATDT